MAKKHRTASTVRYHDKVARLGCMIGRLLGQDHGSANLHHIREGQGMGQRANDYLVVPLCRECHQGDFGVHGNKALMRMLKVNELDLLAITIELMQSDDAGRVEFDRGV